MVADDSYLIREVLRHLLGSREDIDLVGEFADGETLASAVSVDPPDVVIADARMPPMDDAGIRFARTARAAWPRLAVLVLSQYAEPRYALDLVDGGAERRGYLLKERVHGREDLARAVHTLAAGGTVLDPEIVDLLASDSARTFAKPRDRAPIIPLSPRELEVLRLLADGLTKRQASERLFVTLDTVRSHTRSVYRKLDVSDRAEAIAVARATGLL